ncbi:hypothetical protein B4100_2670 [Heyndrickxia coagulans]|nr:hypothetical protein B4100_2670 [Heyndrickxia coagulans]
MLAFFTQGSPKKIRYRIFFVKKAANLARYLHIGMLQVKEAREILLLFSGRCEMNAISAISTSPNFRMMECKKREKKPTNG